MLILHRISLCFNRFFLAVSFGTFIITARFHDDKKLEKVALKLEFS